MAKILILASALLLAVASAQQRVVFPGMGSRGGGFPGGRQMGPGGRGGRGGPGGHRGGPGHSGSHEDHGFPGQGGHGHHPPMPPFLKNVTKEALQEFFSIVRNQNLTKAELQTQLQEWATAQGAEVAQAYSDFVDARKKMEEDLKAKVDEIIKNVTELVAQIANIKSNMGITRQEEREQIRALLVDQSRAVVKVLETIKREAIRPPRPTFVVPTIGPLDPELPEIPGGIPVIM